MIGFFFGRFLNKREYVDEKELAKIIRWHLGLRWGNSYLLADEVLKCARALQKVLDDASP